MSEHDEQAIRDATAAGVYPPGGGKWRGRSASSGVALDVRDLDAIDAEYARLSPEFYAREREIIAERIATAERLVARARYRLALLDLALDAPVGTGEPS